MPSDSHLIAPLASSLDTALNVLQRNPHEVPHATLPDVIPHQLMLLIVPEGRPGREYPRGRGEVEGPALLALEVQSRWEPHTCLGFDA